MASPRRPRPEDSVRDRATEEVPNGTNGNGMSGNGMPRGVTARNATDPMAGGQSGTASRAESGMGSRMESRTDGPAYGNGRAGMAGGGYAAAPSPESMRMAERVQQSAISLPNALLLIAGVWLIISRFVFDFPLAGATAGGVLNGVVIGIAVAIMALVRMSAYRSNPLINAVTVVAGGWMMAAPWAFSYPHFGTNGRPGWSDIIVGGFIIFFGLLGAFGNLARRRPGMGSRMTMGLHRGGGRLATR